MHPKYQQIGNAVPTQLGEAFGTFLKNELAKRRSKNSAGPMQYETMLADGLEKLRSYARNNRKRTSNQLDLFKDDAA